MSCDGGRVRLGQATEMEWLLWFYQNADFGPAHGDVMDCLKLTFLSATGKAEMPPGYEREEVET